MAIKTARLLVFAFFSIVWAASVADGINEPIPSFYQEPGLSNNRQYISQHADERIDPFTGKLQFHFVDLYIPGNGGLDLKVQRSYSSLDEELTEFSPAGLGWTMHFGRVLSRANNAICDYVNGPKTNPVLELPDSGRRVLYLALDGVSWITTDFWKAECNLTAPQGGLNVFSPEGTRYDMTSRGHIVGSPANLQNTYYVSRITDRNNNTLSVNYVFLPTGVYAVASITASDGRAAIFTYQGSTLSKVQDGTSIGSGIAAGSRTWTYVQSAVATDANFLTQVQRPDGASWQFDYNPAPATSAGGYSLRRLTYPMGGSVDYLYAFVNFAQNPAIPRSTVVTKKVATPGGAWNWAYTPASTPIKTDANGGFDFSIPPSAADAAQIDRTFVTGLTNPARITILGTTARFPVSPI